MLFFRVMVEAASGTSGGGVGGSSVPGRNSWAGFHK